jgi:plastocyanin
MMVASFGENLSWRRILAAATMLLAIGEAGQAEQPSSLGVIEGVVSYQTDPARPWRYARYYVKQAKSGELAEAVVAIRAKPLVDASRQPQTVVIDQQNFQFLPETVAIRRGDWVKFTNADPATHNVQTSSDLINFNVTLANGGEETVRFDRAGGIGQPAKIGCVFHSAMQAWIYVFDHSWFTVTPTTGKFRLADVPPGQYDLEMVHPAGSLRWKKRVEVKAGETLRIDIRVSPDDKL